MATVSGIKVFKDSIKFPSYIFQVVDYTCPDEPKSTSFHSMIISPSLIYSTGIDFSGGAFTTVYDSDGWANTYYKTVDFGEAEQTVDDVFFSWLDENIVKEPETKTIRTLTINGTVTTEWNGKPVKQVTVDGVTYKMPETSTTYTIEGGYYLGNDELTEVAFEKETIFFTVGSTNYVGMEMIASMGGKLRYYLSADSYIYAYETAWQDSSYKTILLSSGNHVTTNETFYNWFTANYQPYEEPVTYTIKAGTYTWKNEPTDPYKNILQSNFNITSNGKNYIGINIYGSLDFRYVIAEGNEQFVYSFEGHDWGTEAFKTFAVESDALVSAEFYNFLMENISNYEGAEPQLITVTYTEDTAAGTVTITNQSDFAGYVEVTVSTLAGASIYITTAADTSEGYYKLEANQTRTLNVGGDWPEQQRGDDLIATVTPVLYVEPALIAFTISGIDYQAEEGMTWSEWVASSYNSGGYTESDGKIMRLRKFVYTPAGSVDSSDVIDPNESYTEETGGGTAS